MGFVRQSFKRQIFVTFLAVTLFLVIFGGILTVQGFQARVQADYTKRDRDQEAVVTGRIEDIIEKTEKTLDDISDNTTLIGAFYRGRKNTLIIYGALYEVTQDIRGYAQVDLYMGDRCMYTTASGPKPATMPEYYSILYDAAANSGKTVYALDPGSSSESGGTLLIARQVLKKDEPGYVVIRIEEQELKNQLSGAINARDGFMLTNKFLRPLCLLGTATDGKDLTAIRSNLFSGGLYNEGFENNVYMSELGDSGLLSIYITPPALDESAVRSGYRPGRQQTGWR